jgi:CHAT domain-containing protein
LAEGIENHSLHAYNHALEPLAQASLALRALKAPMARWSAYYEAAALINTGEYALADALLRGILNEASSAEPALIGKTTSTLGVSRIRRADYEGAARGYLAARRHFVQAMEPENLGANSYMLAEVLSFAGQLVSGESEVYRGLQLLSGFRRSTWLNNHLATVAAYARAYGFGYAALAVLDETLLVGLVLEDANYAARTYQARALDWTILDQPDSARRNLREARRWFDQVKEGDSRDRGHAGVKLIDAQITREHDPVAALQPIVEVIDEYRRLNLDRYVLIALYEAAITALKSNDRVAARSHLSEAIAHIEKQQTFYEINELRASALENVEDVFDIMIGLELDDNRPDVAFEYLERSRLASWHPARSSDRSSTNIEVLRRSTSANALVVEYALLPDRLVAWAARREGWRHFTIPVTRDSLAGLVKQFVKESGRVSQRDDAAANKLFELLLRPVLVDVSGVDRITIVPDRELHYLPFGALRDRTNKNRYVVEDFEVRTAPSANFLALSSARERPRPSVGSALIVGNPELSTDASTGLPPLQGAEGEGEAIANIYRKNTLITGGNATLARLQGLLPTHSVLHFAGHAVFNSQRPEMSYLALAPNGASDDGRLYAREIGSLRLSNLKVVVLSACTTLSPRASRTGGVSGLAYSFLRAGTPAAISTLWDVDDDRTRTLLVDFHSGLARGLHPAAALRDAQLQALKSLRPEMRAPQTWAAFIYTGA